MVKSYRLVFILLLSITAFVWADENFLVDVKEGKVTIDVQDYSLREVVITIAIKSNFDINFDKGFEDQKITTKFSLPLEEALQRLLKDASYTVDYKEEKLIAKLIIYPKDESKRQGFDKEPEMPQPPQNANAEALAIIKALQEIDPHLKVLWNHETGYPSFIFGKLTAETKDGKPVEISQAFLQKYAKLLGITEADKQLKMDEHASKLTEDELGNRHVIYQQQEAGVNVYNRSIGVHIDKNGSVNAVEGNFLKDASLATDEKATLPKEDAAKVLRGDVKDMTYKDPTTEKEVTQNRVTEPVLEWYPKKDNKLQLAWYADITVVDDKGGRVERVFVDADSGSVIEKEQRYSDALGEIITRGNTVQWRNITALWYLYPGGYWTYGAPCFGASYMLTLRRTAYDYYCRDWNGNSRLEWGEGTSPQINGAGPTIQYNMARTLEFFKSYYYNRNSYDNNGGAVWCYSIPGLANAYGSAGTFTFGEAAFGAYRQGILANLGVTTHEFTHGLLFSAPVSLSYSGQSAACHEGLSDILGVGAMQWHYGYRGDADCNDYWNLIPVRDLKSQRRYSQYLSNPESHLGGHVLGHCVYLMATQLGTEAAAWSAYYTIFYYIRNTSNLRDAYWKILNTIYLKYGYSYYYNCYSASWWPMYN